MSRLVKGPYYSPEDSNTVNVDAKAPTETDVINLLEEADELSPDDEIELTPKKKEVKKEVIEDKDEEDEEDDKEDKKDDLDDLEEELELDNADEEKLELTEVPRRKEILAKYPDLFKTFPGMEKALYRERAYSEILPSIDDAKIAKEKSEILDNFEGKLLNGDITTILKAVKDESSENQTEAFNHIVDNYLPALGKIDQAAYNHVIGNVLKGTIFHMVKEARASNDDELEQAAALIHKFVFNTTKWTPETKLAKSDPTDKKDDTISRREREFNEKQFTNARDSLHTEIEKIFKSAINKHIDPKDSMTAYVKKAASDDAYKTLNKALENDTRFRMILDKAWKNAFSNGFNTESMGKLKSLLKSRGATVLPTVIKKARNEALKGMGKRVKEDTDELEDNNQEQASPQNRGPLKSKEKINNNAGTKPGQIPKGMSSRDFLLQD